MMGDPIHSPYSKPIKQLHQDFQIQTPTSNDTSFRTHRLRQGLPTLDSMFQRSPYQDHDMDDMFPPTEPQQMNNHFHPQPRRPSLATSSAAQTQPRQPQPSTNNSFQAQSHRPRLQPLRRANTEFHSRTRPEMDPFQADSLQYRVQPPSFPPPLSTQRRPKEEPENPFWLSPPPQPKEPMPTRHKRFKDSFSTIPESTREAENEVELAVERGVEHGGQVRKCEDCTRNVRVAREYWDRNKELEDELGERDGFIRKLKEQRRDLENRVNELMGIVEGRR